MSVWLPAVFAALATILIGAFGYALKRREQSGKIDTSDASVLWDAIQKMLEVALADNAVQRTETKELKGIVAGLEGRIAALQVEIAGLRGELRELRGKVG